MALTNQKVLEALVLARRVTCTSMIVAITEYDVVAALLDTLDTAEELDMDGHKPIDAAAAPLPDHIIAELEKEQWGKRQYHRPDKPKVECPKCHNQVSAMYMLKNGSQCKMCAMKAKRAEREKSQPAEKSQSADLPETWTNKKPEFGREEAIAQIRDMPKDKIDLSSLSGRKL
jgi:hypothetical protein